MTRTKKKKGNYATGKWSKSVADYLQEQGKIITNENLDAKHPKIKHPNLFKK